MITPTKTTTRPGLWLALPIMLIGCGILDKAPDTTRETMASGTTITVHDARVRLGTACDNMVASVAGAAREIERETDDLAIRRFTLVVRIRTLQETQRLLQLEDPRIGALDLWTFAHQILDYFETGDGRRILGELSDIAVATARQQVDAITRSATALLPESLYESSRQEVRAFAKANPILGETFVRSLRPSEDIKRGTDSVFVTIISLPFKPFEIGGGVGEAAAAIDRFSTETEKFSGVVSALPLQMQWNAQYLLLALEDQKSIASALETLNEIAGAAETMSATADELPAELGKLVSDAIDRIEQSQGEIQESLDKLKSAATEVESAATEVKTTMVEAKSTIDSVTEASTSLTATAKAWEPTAKALDHLVNPPSDPDEPPDPDPFKMPQVTEAANALTISAQELQKLVQELDGLVGSDEDPGALSKVDDTAKSAVDHTALRAVDLVDHLMWRAIQLVLVILGAALVFRLVSWKIPKRARTPGPGAAG